MKEEKNTNVLILTLISLFKSLILLFIITGLFYIAFKTIDYSMEAKAENNCMKECKTKPINELPSGWNTSEDRIQHYCYDMCIGGCYNPYKYKLGNGLGLI